MHIQDFTDVVLLRELARRYPPGAAPTHIQRSTGFYDCILPVGNDHTAILTFDPGALELVLHPMPASER
jgi:hypothetical protein